MSHHLDQYAIVTGGSKGIGQAIVTFLVQRGYHVAFSYRTEKDLDSWIKKLGTGHNKVLPIKADMESRDDIERFISSVAQSFERIDVLVNNVGITRDSLLATMKNEHIHQLINTNLLSYIFCCQEVLKVMLPQRTGNIINISSVSAQKPNKGQSVYAATKGAIDAFTRALAVELAPKKIRVNAIAPGIIETTMTKSLLKAHQQLIDERVLCKRIGHVEDITKAVGFLLDNSYITGEVINVNGGLTLS